MYAGATSSTFGEPFATPSCGVGRRVRVGRESSRAGARTAVALREQAQTVTFLGCLRRVPLTTSAEASGMLTRCMSIVALFAVVSSAASAAPFATVTAGPRTVSDYTVERDPHGIDGTVSWSATSFWLQRFDRPAIWEPVAISQGPTDVRSTNNGAGFVDFQLALPSRLVGFYRIEAKVGADFLRDLAGAPVEVVPGVVSTLVFAPDITIEEPHAGTHFLDVLGNEYVETSGADHPIVDAATRKAATPRYGFGIGTPALAPIVADPDVDRLAKELIGRPLWTRGPFHFGCLGKEGSITAAARDRAPLRIRRIARIGGVFTRILLGGRETMPHCGGSCHDDSHLYVENPVMVLFDVDDANVDHIPPMVFSNWRYTGPCQTGEKFFAGAFDLRQRLSTTDPRTANPRWSSNERAALLDYRVIPGMTREQVLWAYGYPTVQPLSEATLRAEQWSWNAGTRLEVTVQFAGDVVTSSSLSTTMSSPEGF